MDSQHKKRGSNNSDKKPLTQQFQEATTHTVQTGKRVVHEKIWEPADEYIVQPSAAAAQHAVRDTQRDVETVPADQTSNVSHEIEHLDGVLKSDEPLTKAQLAVKEFSWNNLEQTRDRGETNPKERRLSILCRSLENLSSPIKLIRLSTVLNMGRFPRYDEEFEFVSLDEASVQTCYSVSHRWTDPANSRSNLDASWLKENLDKIDFGDIPTKSVLLFYDFTSIPQRTENADRTSEECLSFKAGLELIDHLFALRSIVIPTKGYLYRYWCYVEFFIAEYHASLVNGVPFMDCLPRELRWLDEMINVIELFVQIPHRIDQKILDKLKVGVHRASSMLSLEDHERFTLMMHLSQLSSYNETLRIVVYKRFVSVREELSSMVRSRLRQCSISEDSDKIYLNTLVSKYLDKDFGEIREINETSETQVDAPPQVGGEP